MSKKQRAWEEYIHRKKFGIGDPFGPIKSVGDEVPPPKSVGGGSPRRNRYERPPKSAGPAAAGYPSPPLKDIGGNTWPGHFHLRTNPGHPGFLLGERCTDDCTCNYFKNTEEAHIGQNVYCRGMEPIDPDRLAQHQWQHPDWQPGAEYYKYENHTYYPSCVRGSSTTAADYTPGPGGAGAGFFGCRCDQWAHLIGKGELCDQCRGLGAGQAGWFTPQPNGNGPPSGLARKCYCLQVVYSHYLATVLSRNHGNDESAECCNLGLALMEEEDDFWKDHCPWYTPIEDQEIICSGNPRSKWCKKKCKCGRTECIDACIDNNVKFSGCLEHAYRKCVFGNPVTHEDMVMCDGVSPELGICVVGCIDAETECMRTKCKCTGWEQPGPDLYEQPWWFPGVPKPQ